VNRERILLVSVLAIIALWFFTIREVPQVIEKAQVGKIELKRLPVPSADYPTRLLELPKENPPFTLVTNVRPSARPDLAEAVSDYLGKPVPQPYGIPDIWLPTSRSLSVDQLGKLRRPAAAPVEGAATLQLPDLPGRGGTDATTGEQEERVDTWRSFRNEQRGRVVEIIAGGKRYAEPLSPPEPGPDLLEPANRFWTLLLALEDPDAAREAGITEVRARITGLAAVRQKYGEEMSDFAIGTGGTQAGWIDGARAFVRLGGGNVEQNFQAGKKLLEEGASSGNEDRIRWALVLLGRAKDLAQKQAAGAQPVRRRILLAMLDAANRLNRQELVLSLALEHLEAFPDEQEVLEYVGNILSSRSFNLLDYAARFYERARASTYAQRRLVEVLVRLNRFDEARAVLDSGRTGSGPEVDLLRARVALAMNDLEAASVSARRDTGSADAAIKAEAYQILGAVAYVRGEAADAEAAFLEAVQAAPGRSTAYSDLGLACAVQGRVEDAKACFARALELDPIDNSVMPRLGTAWLDLAAGDAFSREADAIVLPDARDVVYADTVKKRDGLRSSAAERYAAAGTQLSTLQDDNPTDMLVRFTLAYAKERSGNLEEAATLYRSTIDTDYRYRVAIARLGLVQARIVEGGGDASLAPQAVAHLKKAVALNPTDPTLPYILGRFLLLQGTSANVATQMFDDAQRQDPKTYGDLPFWAQLGAAFLLYRDENKEEREVKAALNRLLDRIKDDAFPPGTGQAELMKNNPYAAATVALEVIKETEQKVEKTWDFEELTTRPPDWKYHGKLPMKVSVLRGKGLVFGGEVDYGGDSKPNVFDFCSAEYNSGGALNGNTFYALDVKGFMPEAGGGSYPVEFGVGVVNASRGREGPTGILVKRKARSGTVELNVDGAESQRFRQVKNDYVEMQNVPWPTGEFTLRIEVEPEYDQRQRTLGRFRLYLNGQNVFEQELEQKSERCSIFGRGRSNQQILLYLWVQGSEGMNIPEIQVQEVMVTMSK